MWIFMMVTPYRIYIDYISEYYGKSGVMLSKHLVAYMTARYWNKVQMFIYALEGFYWN